MTSDKYREGFLEEIQVQSRINHPHLVSVIGVAKANIVCSESPQQYELVPDDRNLMLVAQYCAGGSLRDYLKLIRTKQRPFDEAVCLRIVHEIAMGMAMLHDGKIIHMDLKPGNIFLTENTQAMVGDFGLATEVNVQMGVANTLDSMMTGFVNFKGGTLYYLPPECFTVHKMTKAADVYAYAIILHNVFVTQDEDQTYDAKEILGGEIPTKFNQLLVEKVCGGLRPDLPFRTKVKLTVETQQKVYDLMTRCWSESPKDRPRFEAIAKELRKFREVQSNRTPTPTSGFGFGQNLFSPAALSRAPSPAPAAEAAISPVHHQDTIPLHNSALAALQQDSQAQEPPLKAGLNLPPNRHFISADAKTCSLCGSHKAAKDGVLCPIDAMHFICKACLPVQLTRQEDIFCSTNIMLFNGASPSSPAFMRFDHRIFCTLCASTSLPPRLTTLPLPQLITCLGLEVVQDYFTLERELLFRCGNCNEVRSLDVLQQQNQLMDDIACYNQLERFLTDESTGLSRFQDFVYQLGAFVTDELSLEDFYQSLYTTFFPELKVYSDEQSWQRMDTILHFLAARSEKRCALQLRYYRDRPRIKTSCCCEEPDGASSSVHCFTCQSHGYHEEKCCSEISGSKYPDVVRCVNCAKAIVADGSDAFTCSCGTVFNWMELIERCDGCAAFYASHPENTVYEAALSLCSNGVEETELRQAQAMYKRHPIEIARGLKLWLRRRHAFYPSQFCAVCYDENEDASSDPALSSSSSSLLPSGVKEAMKLWRLENKDKITKCEDQNDFAINSLFPSLISPLSALSLDGKSNDQTLLSIAAYNLLSFDGDQLYNMSSLGREDRKRLKASAQQWKEDHLFQYNQDIAGYEVRQAKRFVSLFKNVPWQRLKPCQGAYLASTVFNVAISDENLRFSDYGLTVERPGSVSCYPAAFADLMADHAFMTVEIVSSNSSTNFFTFGLAMQTEGSSNTITVMAKTNSDGVGRSPDTWGIADDRGKSTETATFAASGFQLGFMPRKLKTGDRITAIVNTQQGWLIITVTNDNSHEEERFEQRFAIPQGSSSMYRWALTLANDFKVKIVTDTMSLRYHDEDGNHIGNAASSKENNKVDVSLNEDQTKMLVSLQHLLRVLYQQRNEASTEDATQLASSIQWLELAKEQILVADSLFELRVEGSKRQAFNGFEGIMPWLEDAVLSISSSSSSGNYSNHSFDEEVIDVRSLTVQGVIEAISWFFSNRGYFLQQQQQIMAQTFALMSGGSQGAPSIAALTLYDYYETANNSKPSEQQRMALAYMRCNSAAMQAWYDREKHQADPFVPNIAGNCRCLPRHTGSSCSVSSQQT